MTYQTAYAEQAAVHFIVMVRTIYCWRARHRDFVEAVIAGKEQKIRRHRACRRASLSPNIDT